MARKGIALGLCSVLALVTSCQDAETAQEAPLATLGAGAIASLA
jgi:hypothetical protein